MRVLIKLLILLAVVAIGVYAYVRYGSPSGTAAQAQADRTESPVRVEEQYGFTSETVEP